MKHITLSNSLNFFASAPTWNVVRIEVVELNDTKLKTTTKNGWATEIRNKLSIYRWSQTQLNMVLTVHHFFPCYPCRCCCCTRMTKKNWANSKIERKKKHTPCTILNLHDISLVFGIFSSVAFFFLFTLGCRWRLIKRVKKKGNSRDREREKEKYRVIKWKSAIYANIFFLYRESNKLNKKKRTTTKLTHTHTRYSTIEWKMSSDIRSFSLLLIFIFNCIIYIHLCMVKWLLCLCLWTKCRFAHLTHIHLIFTHAISFFSYLVVVACCCYCRIAYRTRLVECSCFLLLLGTEQNTEITVNTLIYDKCNKLFQQQKFWVDITNHVECETIHRIYGRGKKGHAVQEEKHNNSVKMRQRRRMGELKLFTRMEGK